MHFLTYAPSQKERVVDLALYEDGDRLSLSQGKSQGMLRVRLGYEQLRECVDPVEVSRSSLSRVFKSGGEVNRHS